MIKRSECKCICHTDAVTLGLVAGPMHTTPCCELDDKFKNEYGGRGSSMKDPTVISNLDFSKGFDQQANCGQLDFDINNAYARAIWNKAIEAAAVMLEKEKWVTVPNIIRKLKK